MTFNLNQLKKALQHHLKENLPEGAGVVFILTGANEAGQFELVSGTNLPQGPACAVLAEVLRSRIQHFQKLIQAEQELPVEAEGSA